MNTKSCDTCTDSRTACYGFSGQANGGRPETKWLCPKCYLVSGERATIMIKQIQELSK